MNLQVLLQQLAEELIHAYASPTSADPTTYPSHNSEPWRGRWETRRPEPLASRTGVETRPTHESGSQDADSPFAPPLEAVLRGPLDAINCGDFSFALYTAQLMVSMLGTSGGIGGEYAVPTLQLHRWTRLIGRDGSPLPILALRDHGRVALKVGNVPATGSPTISPTR